MLVNKSIEAGTTRAAVEPEDDGVLGRVPLGDDKVIEEVLAMILVNGHIPS